jgi:phage baseplate assembly protein W
MSTDFLVPFALTPQGQIATTSDPNVIALQRVESLVGTPNGERVMIPTYGVDLPEFLFAPDIQAEVNNIANEISAGLQTWEPTINVIDVTPVVTDASVGVDNVIVDFSTANPAITPTQTATVLVGGTVVNN